MSTQPSFAATPLSPVLSFSAANTNRDGTGTIGLLCAARVPGSRVQRVQLRATGTTTAGVIRIFKRDSGLALNGDGTIASWSAPSWRLIEEVLVTALTPGTTQKVWSGEWAPLDGFDLGPFEALGIATHNAEGFTAQVFGGHL
jgi:hypothetical protein